MVPRVKGPTRRWVGETLGPGHEESSGQMYHSCILIVWKKGPGGVGKKSGGVLCVGIDRKAASNAIIIC